MHVLTTLRLRSETTVGGRPRDCRSCSRRRPRLVPFDAFSFLWGEPVGWHDSWSKTRAVLVNGPYADV